MVGTGRVLIVDGGDEQRRAVAAVLDAHGCATIEVGSVHDARSVLEREPDVRVVIVLDDACAAAALLASEHTDAKVIVCADRPPVPGAIAVAPADDRGLLAAVGTCLDDADDTIDLDAPVRPRATADVVAAHLDDIERRWAELCLWDPSQPPDAEPAIPKQLLRAIVEALHHPQPIGWGLDPALNDVVELFAERVATPDQAIAQLSCLRRALHEVIVRDVAVPERHQVLERASAVLDHTMMTGASLRTARLRTEALTDALTGLGNRRAFDRDLERDTARARRTGAPMTVAVIDLDGLKRINDHDGHAAGDRAIASMGHALRATARRSDRAYRIGGDEFAVLLSDSLLAEPELLLDRLRKAGAPPCSIGIASAPPEPLEELLERADAALYRSRRERIR